jgi:hypothetical protein
MKSVIFWALAALNVVLLAALVAPYTKDNAAYAARGRRPDFLMIPGRVIGQNSSVVYIIDTANRRLGAVALGANGRDVAGMAPIGLERVFSDQQRQDNGAGAGGAGTGAGRGNTRGGAGARRGAGNP